MFAFPACAHPEGISKQRGKSGKSGKSASWLSILCPSMACSGNAFRKVTITVKARFGNRNQLSEIGTLGPGGKSPTEITKR